MEDLQHSSVDVNSALHRAAADVAPVYLPFSEAREFARTLDLKTRKEWRAYVKGSIPGKPLKPVNVPSHPDGIYKVKGWQGWKFWLGTADDNVRH